MFNFLSVTFHKQHSRKLTNEKGRSVFKSGNKDSPVNYRPISLTHVPCKIMEHVIYYQIINFLGSKLFFFSLHNINFRRASFAKLSWPPLFKNLHINLSCKLQTEVNFLDFAKDFDKVHQQVCF